MESRHVRSHLQPPSLPLKVARRAAQIRPAPSPCGSSPTSPSATLPYYSSDGDSSDSKELAQSDTSEPNHLKRVKANLRILGEVNSVFLAKIYTLRQYQNLPMDPWIDRHYSKFETLIKDSWIEVRNSLPSEAREHIDEEPNEVCARGVCGYRTNMFISIQKILRPNCI